MAKTRSLLQKNQLLNAEIKRRVDQISAINMVAATVGHSLDLDVTLNTALEAVVDVVGAEAAGISLIDEEAGVVVLRAQLGWMNDFVHENPMRIPLGKGMSGQVINNDDVVVHNRLDGNETYAVPSFRKEHFRSIAMAPMHARGKIIGILSIMSHQPNRFDTDVVTVLRSIADTVGVAVDNARLYENHVEQENRLNAILHSTADGIIATDQKGRINLCNAAAAAMLDTEAKTLIGTPLREAAIQSRVRDKLLATLTAGEPTNHSFQVQLETGRTFSISISPVRVQSQVSSGQDNMDGWVIVLQDITHVREAEIARVQFIQAAAHDMKNPLSVTQSSIRMLESMLDADNQTVQEVIHIARQGIERIQRLIDDLLQIEKIESGYDFRQEEVDVREMCYEIGAQMRLLMQKNDLTFQVNIAPEVPQTLMMDREWMHRAIHNYLENAAKYSRPGGEVRFCVYVQEDLVRFEVTDNGPGIPLSAQSQIFDRFYRVQNRRDVAGSGLGLAIVKSVAEAHGGDVYIRSKEEEGSVFGLTLPLKQPAQR